MNFLLESYAQQQTLLPTQGRHIVAYRDANSGDVVVYQAFNADIARYAVANQRFGGPHYSFSRMTWIKPNFMWMMYRAGWATKPQQERILAISMLWDGWLSLLGQAVFSSYQPDRYANQEEWRADLARYEVRLQWDPDHDPAGQPLSRRAIQLGMKGEVQRQFNEAWITGVTDITPFVHTRHAHALHQPHRLEAPVERVLDMSAYPHIIARLGLDT